MKIFDATYLEEANGDADRWPYIYTQQNPGVKLLRVRLDHNDTDHQTWYCDEEAYSCFRFYQSMFVFSFERGVVEMRIGNSYTEVCREAIIEFKIDLESVLYAESFTENGVRFVRPVRKLRSELPIERVMPFTEDDYHNYKLSMVEKAADEARETAARKMGL